MSDVIAIRPCSMCQGPMDVKRIGTSVPGTLPVDLAMCLNCDTRTCDYLDDGVKCCAHVLDGRAKRCPRGHLL